MIPDEFGDLLLGTARGALESSGVWMVILDIGSGFWGARRQIGVLLGVSRITSVVQQAGANGCRHVS